MANYTPNYQLHQWAPEDKFLRTDFNEDLNKIDTALGEHETRMRPLEEKIVGLGNCGIYLSSRQGAGARDTTYTVSFPKRPAFVIIMGAEGGVGFFAYGATACMCSANNVVHELKTHWSGNTLTAYVGSDASVGLNNNELYYIYAILDASANS